MSKTKEILSTIIINRGECAEVLNINNRGCGGCSLSKFCEKFRGRCGGNLSENLHKEWQRACFEEAMKRFNKNYSSIELFELLLVEDVWHN